MANGAHLIHIRPHALGVTVSIEPDAHGEDVGGNFPDARKARGYASGLKMVRGWPIVDHIGEASNG